MWCCENIKLQIFRQYEIKKIMVENDYNIYDMEGKEKIGKARKKISSKYKK